ncbi:MAG: TolC family protein [Phaeodactylibacter sp.]|uniref:TolC family protein n=1 Tax=Phaeodactylibacter sp. TaxID=1940289 RepID=UPI0032EBF161
MRYVPFLCLLFVLPGWAQEPLSLEQAYQLAEQAYPLTAQGGLLRSASALRQEGIDKARLPQISWNAQASLQSEVVEFPFELPVPGGAALDLPLYRFQTTADVQYNLYDGGRIDARQEEERARLAVSEAQLQVDLEGLKARVNQYVFGILLHRERLRILESSTEQLQSRTAQVQSGVEHGVLLPGELKRLEAEALRLDSEVAQVQGQVRALCEGLSVLLGRAVPNEIQFELPEQEAELLQAELQRPELLLFAQQQQQVMSGLSGIEAGQKPIVGAFLQAGIGAPNPLNFFDNSLSPFAMGGVRFTWNFVDWGKAGRSRQLLSLQKEMIGQQRAAFTTQIEQQEVQIRTEMATLDQQIERGRAITQLQEEVLQQIDAQLREGTAVAADYITQSAAVRQAQLNVERYRLQQQQLYIQLLTLKGIR